MSMSMSMSRSRLLLASLASAAALSSSFNFFNHPLKRPSTKEAFFCSDQHRSSLRMEKFAPRFDGLRFIETLVTGHR
ncbi:hypothetical protein CKAN_01540600 [Cinnamomum micranthum f. kanehirae]|uniref:Secreted protein n=1 Tax=Cinnamomum micranthum f. kanehirae TaxID=337451 RepID=A0A3S3NTZ7_9MAGN|nr:hypothetical protein CKAN_01540600 [Cinnamomum micranthum f. kanehirae]